jgi:cytochrome c-type biogenesis protein CcmH/NrfF
MATTERNANGGSCRPRFAWVCSAFALIVLSVVLVAAPLLRAQQQDARAKELSMRMMCVCTCNQILGVCNHVGCTYSHDMLKELDSRVGRSESDDLILQGFVQEYGAAVILLPAAKGFNLWIWIMPFVAIAGGILLVRMALLRWRKNAVVATPSRVSPDLLARARREMGPDE